MGESMSDYTRFGIYFLPGPGAFAEFGAHWLGWDVERGRVCDQPDIPQIDAVIKAPRKYGFHGTLKPPFRLAEGQSPAALKAAIADLCTDLTPAVCAGLELTRMGDFLAFTPTGDTTALAACAARIVRDLDPFRAALSETELRKRHAAGLSAGQAANLRIWGYPYVLDEFRFHMTLSGKLAPARMQEVARAIARLAPPLPSPFVVDRIALVGERRDGMFETLHRYALTG